ncbi:MAG: hypothetical protein ACLFN5_01330 [bacterium]
MQLPKTLEQCITSGRVANSYLFYGREVDHYKKPVSDFFSRLLCKDGGCGKCLECRQIKNANHPDLITLPGTSKPIGVQVVREEIIEPASLTPVRSDRRLFWLNDIARFTPQAANTLLKVLEEPPGDKTVFVLTARSRWDCLDTIRSRCQWIRFPEKSGSEQTEHEICQSFWPETKISDEQFENWQKLLAGKIHAGELKWSKNSARGFLGFLLEKTRRKYCARLNPETEQTENSEKLSYRLIDQLLEKIKELQQGGKPVMIINSILEELYYPEESEQWPHVI